MMEWWQRREHRWGLVLGAIALLTDLIIKWAFGLPSLADPLPLFLALGQLTRGATRGLLYWRVEPALLHLAFLTGIVLLTFLLLAWRKTRGDVALDLVRAALVAIAPALILRMVTRVDHVIVAFYYALSAAMSAGWTLFLSRQLNRILNRIGYNPGNQ